MSAFFRWQLGQKGKGKLVSDLSDSYYSHSLFFINLLGDGVVTLLMFFFWYWDDVNVGALFL